MKSKPKIFALSLIFFLVSLSFIGLVQIDTSMLVRSEDVSLESTGFGNVKNATVISDDETQWNTGNAGASDITTDTMGNLHVVWSDTTVGAWGGGASDYEIMYCNYTSANGWSNATVISDDSNDWNTGNSWMPSMAIDGSNNIHVVWYDFTDGDWWGTDTEIMYCNYTAASGWSNATVISDDVNDWNDGDSSDPCIGVDGSGNVHVVWDDNTVGVCGADTEIMYSNNTGNGWLNATLISNNFDLSINPTIAVTNAGNLHVAWEDDTDGGWWGSDREIFYCNYTTATGWSSEIVISDDINDWNDDTSRTPSIAVNDSGTVHVAWDDDTAGVWGSDYEIMACNYTTATGWSNATVISDDATDWNTDEGDAPDIAIDGSGNVHVVWEDMANGEWGTDTEIMYAHTGSAWSNATVISDDATLWNNDSSGRPAITIDGSGKIHVVWVDSTPGAWGSDMEIMYTTNFAFDDPIVITSNADLEAANMSAGADGSEGNPYVIRDKIIYGGNGINTCINITNVDAYFVLENCMGYNGTYGIYFKNASNGMIQNCTARNNTANGIALYNSNNTRIDNNTVLLNVQDGIWSQSSNYTTITNNTIYNNTRNGIGLSYSNYSTIENNTIYNNTAFTGSTVSNGIYFYISSNNTIHDNDIFQHDGKTLTDSGNGIHFIIESNNNTVTQNRIYNHTGGTSSASGTGISISTDSIENTLENNTIYYSEVGIFMNDGNWTRVINNTIRDQMEYGIRSYYTDNLTISENTIHGITGASGSAYCVGIYFYENDNNTINDNTLYNNIATTGSQYSGMGIYIIDSHDNYINDNTIYNNSGADETYSGNGMYLSGSTNNMIYDNTVFNCSGSQDHSGNGFYIMSQDNTFINNSAYNNSFTGSRTWSGNGFLIRGNNNTLINNSAIDNGAGANANDYSENGIVAVVADNTTAYNNTCMNNYRHGIVFYESQFCNATSNTIGHSKGTEYSSGIYLNTDPGNHTLSNNEIYDCVRGISVLSAAIGNVIENNRIHDIHDASSNYYTGVGIYVYGSSENNITGNTIYNCSETSGTEYAANGIHIRDSDENIIDNNTIYDIPGQDHNCGNGILLHTGSELNIISNNVIYNYSITAASDAGNGIYLKSCNNNTIINNTISNGTGTAGNAANGIYVENSNYCDVINNTISMNDGGSNSDAGNGIFLDLGSSYINISQNTLYNNTASGSSAFGCGIATSSSANWNCTIDANLIYNNSRHGMELRGVYNTSITRNTIFNQINYGAIGLYTCGNVSIINNNCSMNGNGIQIRGSNDTIIEDNTINNNTAWPDCGIIIESISCHNEIRNNTINYNYHGIWFDGGSSFNTIINNTINYNLYEGISFEPNSNCNNISITENVISHNDRIGIWIRDSTNITIEENSNEYNDVGGIYVTDSVKIDILNNTLSFNTDEGVYFTGVNFSTIMYNTINNDSFAAIYLEDNCWNTTIENNSINYNTGAHTIVLENSYNTTIKYNDLYGNAFPCVEETSGSENNTIEANNCTPIGPSDSTYPTTSSGTVFFNWTALSWADWYLIYRGNAPLTGLSENFWLHILSSGELVGNVTTNNFTDTITGSGTYYYAIIGVNDTLGMNSTALTFGPITVTVGCGGVTPIAPEEIVALIFFLTIGIVALAGASLYFLDKKEKIDLNEWKDKLSDKLTVVKGKIVKSDEAGKPKEAKKKAVEKIEPKKKPVPAKPKVVEKKVKPKAKPVPAKPKVVEKKVAPVKKSPKPKKAKKKTKSKKKKTKKKTKKAKK